MAAPAIIEPIVQKEDGDCAIASMAMVLGKAYLEVADAARAMSPTALARGLHTTEIIRLLKRLGIDGAKSVPLKGLDTSEETGLVLTKKHVAVLFNGILIDPANGLLYHGIDVWEATTHNRPYRIIRL